MCVFDECLCYFYYQRQTRKKEKKEKKKKEKLKKTKQKQGSTIFVPQLRQASGAFLSSRVR